MVVALFLGKNPRGRRCRCSSASVSQVSSWRPFASARCATQPRPQTKIRSTSSTRQHGSTASAGSRRAGTRLPHPSPMGVRSMIRAPDRPASVHRSSGFGMRGRVGVRAGMTGTAYGGRRHHERDWRSGWRLTFPTIIAKPPARAWTQELEQAGRVHRRDGRCTIVQSVLCAWGWRQPSRRSSPCLGTSIRSRSG
jgi:hypothetical protein